jgi:hypothetical protein
MKDKVAAALLAQTWIYAKTMPQFPHWYCLRKNWVGELPFDDVVTYMREHSYNEKFFTKTFQRYDIDEFKYWTMGFPLSQTILINRAIK